MKNLTNVKSILRFAGRLAGKCLLPGMCLLLGTQVVAQGTPPGGPPIPPTSSSPGEEVTSLPILAGQEGGGFRLSGDPTALQDAVISVKGRGNLEVNHGAQPGTYELLFHGGFQIELAPQVLQSGRVDVAFQVRTPFAGGFASFGFFGTQPTSFALSHLSGGMDLPVELLAGQSDFYGHGFDVGAMHLEAGYVIGSCRFSADRITLTQASGVF